LETELETERIAERTLDLRLIARQLHRGDAQRADRDGEKNREAADRGEQPANDAPDDPRSRAHISTTSNWSGAYIASAWSRIDLPVSSSSAATLLDSSSSSRSMTSGRARTSSS